MLKEIYEQPTAIRETIGARLNENSKCDFDELKFSKEYLESINQIYFVACGTAMHAGLAGKNMIEHLCNIPCQVDIASEFRYRNPIIDDKTLCIFISQSGETADTIAALKLSKENVYTIGDGYSDIEMVKNFNGYAMKKSVDELKKMAKKEYDSVSELINEI